MITTSDQEFGEEFLDQILDWIADNLDPEDVFDEGPLDGWADRFGYVRVTDEQG